MKKFLYALAFIIVLGVSGLSLTACCSSECQVKVTFLDVDPNMGVQDYKFNVDYRGTTNIEFIVPEGYEHSGLTATINGNAYDLTDAITIGKDAGYDEPANDQDHLYANTKKISFEINPVIGDLDIVFDMSTVRLHQFDVNITSQLYTLGTPREEKTKPFQLMSIKPEYGSNFVNLPWDLVNSVTNFTTNNMTVDYGNYLILIYNYQDTNADLSTIYSDVGYFTPRDKVVGNYSIYESSRKGNQYYTYMNASGNEVGINNSVRMFFIGKIQEDIDFYSYIPGFVEEKGFKFDKDPNTFYFLSNKHEQTQLVDPETGEETTFESEYLVNINFYKKSDVLAKDFDPSNLNFDKLGDTVIEKMTPSDQIVSRYDVYKYYIGEDLATDNLLSSEQKKDLTQDMYISIESELIGKEHKGYKALKFCLISYEKEGAGSRIYPYHEIEFNTLESDSIRGIRYIKVTREMIERYILDRVGVSGSDSAEYTIGSAILYTTMPEDYIDSCRNCCDPTCNNAGLPCHEYFVVFGKAFYEGAWLDDGPVDYDYKVDFFIKNSDSDVYNYGHVDYTIDDDLNENHTIFRVTDLYDKVGDEWVYKNNLYCRIEGLEWEDELSPTISNITIENQFHERLHTNVYISNPQVYNGIILDINLDGFYRTLVDYGGYGRAHALFDVYIYKTSKVNQQILVDFSGLNVEPGSQLYVTNNKTIMNTNDFTSIDYISYTETETLNLALGQYCDLVYFALNGSDITDFDIYYTPDPKDTRKLTETRQLFDIAGNPVVVVVNGMPYNVYVKYLTTDFYSTYNDAYRLYAR